MMLVYCPRSDVDISNIRCGNAGLRPLNTRCRLFVHWSSRFRHPVIIQSKSSRCTPINVSSPRLPLVYCAALGTLCCVDGFVRLRVDRYNFRTKTVENPPPFSSSSINSFQLMLSKFELDGKLNPNFSAGPFELRISIIKVQRERPPEKIKSRSTIYYYSYVYRANRMGFFFTFSLVLRPGSATIPLPED